MLIHNNKITCYANSYVIISTSCKYMSCKMYIIVTTHTSNAISSIRVLNDLCLCIKRLYIYPHLCYAIPYYIPHHIAQLNI